MPFFRLRRLVPAALLAGATAALAAPPDPLDYIISRGKVEVWLPGGALVATILPGDYFSELEMLEIQACDLSFRASPEEPVEALVLSRDDFYTLISQSAAAEHTLRQAAVQRGSQYCPLEARPKAKSSLIRTRKFSWRI